MKKSLMTMLCMLPMGAYALNVGIENDVTVTSSTTTMSFDQDGNEFTVGGYGLSFSNSDTVRIGVAYETSLMWGLSGGTSVEYTTDDDFVLGVDTGFNYWGANLDADFTWNVNEGDIDAKLGTGYEIFGLDGSLTSNWDIDDFSYEGFDVSAGYTWAVADNFSVRPNVTLPFDDGFSRGDLTAGVSISVSFGSVSE